MVCVRYRDYCYTVEMPLVLESADAQQVPKPKRDTSYSNGYSKGYVTVLLEKAENLAGE
jgi:hypothetical protein